MIIQKQYARRNIEGYVSPYALTLRLIPISGVKEIELLQYISRSMIDTPSRDLDTTDPTLELQSMIDHAADAYHPETWVVAYNDEGPIGLVFAQRYHDKLEEGSLFFIGILPEHRGKGLGKVLHAKGLELLASIGVKEYVGSTDVRNLPMIEVFKANDCRLYAIRDVDVKVGLV